MKIFTSFLLGAIFLTWDSNYLGFYGLGYVGSAWEIFDPFFTGPTFLLLSLALFICVTSMLFFRTQRKWGAGVILAYIIFIIFFFNVLPAPGVMTIYGIRSHVMQTETLDDLRQFARIADEKHLEVWHGDLGKSMDSKEYQKLQMEYPFLGWEPGLLPTVDTRDGVVLVEWGGALPGHWGFQVRLDGKHLDLNPDRDGPHTRILRASDDIIFFDGD